MRPFRPVRIEPGPGQESVWDYPRPPAVVESSRLVRVEHAGTVIAASRRALRVLETAGAPTWYLPREDVRMDLLRPVPARRSICEWKGEAIYFDVVVGDAATRLAAWSYPSPQRGFEELAGRIAFYAGRVSAFVDDERVTPQPGGFYGGWVTADVVGPFKGEPGTEGW